jgi:hypothetical protein
MGKLIGSFGRAVEEIEGEELEFEFFGERFRIASNLGAMPFLKFAQAAAKGVDTYSLEGLNTMHDLIRDCLPPDEYRDPTEEEIAVGVSADQKILVNSEWARFQDVATNSRATFDQFWEVCAGIYEALAARPTNTPRRSESGQSTTSKKSSTKSSHSKASGNSKKSSKKPAKKQSLSLVADEPQKQSGMRPLKDIPPAELLAFRAQLGLDKATG